MGLDTPDQDAITFQCLIKLIYVTYIRQQNKSLPTYNKDKMNEPLGSHQRNNALLLDIYRSVMPQTDIKNKKKFPKSQLNIHENGFMENIFWSFVSALLDPHFHPIASQRAR